MIKILDCTLRDGGYINNWKFTENFLLEYFYLMNKYYIDYVELGFINTTENYRNTNTGPVRHLTAGNINYHIGKEYKTVVMADYKSINMDLLTGENKLRTDLIRIAFHKTDLQPALELCSKIKKLGYSVSVNAMAITNYSSDELEYLIDYVNDHNLDVLYIADSYGSLNNKKIKYYFELLNDNLNEEIAIGLHLHNNMNNAYSNFEFISSYYKDIKCNRELIIDTTLYGMGRGAGNLQTELVLFDMDWNYNLSKIDNKIELLKFINRTIKKIYSYLNNNYNSNNNSNNNKNKKDYTTWGYDLDYLLSGYLCIHPNYVAKLRDLDINMESRIDILLEIYNNYDYKYFDLLIFNNFEEVLNIKEIVF